MKSSKNNKSLFLNFLLLFFVQFSFGQLSSFTLNVVPTHETCTGNGVLNFNVSGTVFGSTMDFAVYLLPNVTTPLATVTASSLTGLNSGNYRVVATQSLGGNSASKQQDVTINNAISLLSFSLGSIKVKCGNDGVIQVNVSTGSPVSYQILSGPVTTSQQSSNVFNGLPAGIYQIRVFDSCGEAVVQTYTLQQESVSLIIDPVSFQTNILPSCNTILVSNYFGVLSSSIIAFPLTFNYTVFPPSSGTPISYSQTLNSGSVASQIIPFYNNQSYYYNLQVIDACGNVYNRNNNIVNKKFNFTANVNKLNCTDLSLQFTPEFYVAPYAINFLTFPAGFNPITFNSNHPGPFSGIVTNYGGVGNSFPIGDYSVQITDTCGRTMIKNVSVVDQNPPPIAVGSNNGCGNISIQITGNQMVSVIITSAPSSYAFPLPQDVSINLNSLGTEFVINGLPQGTYVFQVTDSCGVVSVVSAVVSPYAPLPISVIQRPGCSFGFGSVIVNDSNGISNAILVSAPSSYSGTLPQNLTANISSNSFYFGSVPEGNYTFQFTSNCGAIRTSTIFVDGYENTSSVFDVTENCGSFNLFLQYNSNGTFLQSYWLQKLNTTSGQWEHPQTGSIYTNGSSLNATNSVSLINNINNLNLAYSGHFRILKNFRYLVNSQYESCIQVIHEFDFLGGPKILDVNAFLCAGSNNDVIVEAIGLPPLNYSITTKNGLPFVVNNGTSNIFSGIEPAIYNFQVQDVCGNIVNSIFDITPFEPLSIIASPFCNGQEGLLSVPLYSFLTYEWWKGTATSTILSTSNSLSFSPFNSSLDFGTYYVRIKNMNSSSACVGVILEYVIPNNSNSPNAGIDSIVSYCGNQGSIDLFSLLSGTFDTIGTWQEITSSGFLVNNLWNSSSVAPGNYQFKYRVDGLCGVFDESFVTISIKEIPQNPIASGDSIVCQASDLMLYASLIPGATYQWNGPNGFVSTDQNPIITNVLPSNSGIYSVKAIANGCESATSSITVSITPLPQLSAGLDNSISYCGTQGTINLFNLIQGNYDLGGTWLELTNSGALTENNWNSNGLNFGTYQFRYSIDGTCNFYDESFVNITLNEIPQSPIASVNAVVCDNQDLELFATTISGATYQWTGPNGFSSSLQNPVIIEASNVNSGIYTVKTLLNGCESIPASVEVVISQLPQFSIDLECINNVATLTATTLNNSFDESTSTYNWSNSNGYSSSINPTAITGEDKGIYTLKVTNTLGCSTTQTINVLNTLCTIPKGITPNADSANDTFDLSGFTGVRDVKIFNRYGMVVFEQDNYTNQWYGQQKGSDKLLPDGTYYYLVNFENSEPKTGWVYLLKED